MLTLIKKIHSKRAFTHVWHVWVLINGAAVCTSKVFTEATMDQYLPYMIPTAVSIQMITKLQNT